MFVKETLEKLDGAESFAPYVVTLVGGRGVAVSGVKRVLAVSEEEIKIAVPRAVVKIAGGELVLTEIGGGDAYVTGRIGGVEIA